MRRYLVIALALFDCTIVAQAQERKIEISPFAGGYFSAGFESQSMLIRGALVGTPPVGAPSTLVFTSSYTPLSEPNSGIFGVRASYDLSTRLTLEGAFGFSPAGLRGYPAVWTFASLSDFLTPPSSGVSTPSLSVGSAASRGKDTYNYSGSVLFHWRKGKGWAPFIAGGMGAIQ